MIEEFINAAQEGDTEEMDRMLKDDPKLLYAMKDNGETPVMAALYHGKQNVIQYLLEFGIPITLHEAVALGDVETMLYLINEEKVSIMDYSYDGWTPLHLAAFFGGYEIAEILIQRGADVNAISDNKLASRPIHAATAGRKYPIVELLLKHQADPNLQQEGGWTPLHQAVQNYDDDMIRLLLDHGADPKIAREDGYTAMRIAEELEYEEIVKQLRQE